MVFQQNLLDQTNKKLDMGSSHKQFYLTDSVVTGFCLLSGELLNESKANELT